VRLAAAAVVLALCGACPRDAAPPSMATGELRIVETTSARVNPDLEIGTGNFWEEGGRLTCGLWITDRKAGGAPEHVRVHAGQVLERAGHRLEVVDVTRDGGRGTVVLKITPLSP
jgi:hypothetical protein